ncbi:hypothetical protein F5Y15DRAFT_377221 [Xylariaceae sp. FL0016]|nr:hypothetical protein F5Y15DRAFT_377221 [Xylariaceae sp. FL0016]
MKMASTKDKRRVYLLCRAIFTGDKALIRQPKKIRKEIAAHPKNLKSLTNDLGAEKVVEILRDLLERRIFQSELKAKIEFPELYHSSPAQETQREASEVFALQSTAEAIEEIASVEEAEPESEEEPVVLEQCNHKEKFGQSTVFQNRQAEEGQALPSLYPTYIPYKSQHIILNEAQRILEECCFDFCQKWLQTVLEEHGWDCATSVELTKWTKFLAKKANKFPSEAIDLGNVPLTEVLFATNKLRHSAVHRLSTTARGVNDLLKSAVLMASTLRDHMRAAQLAELCYELESKIKAMELNKNAIEHTAMLALEDIERQREELRKKERLLVEKMLKDDLENKAFVGLLLEESIRRIADEAAEMVPDQSPDGNEEVDDERPIEPEAVLMIETEPVEERVAEEVPTEPWLEEPEYAGREPDLEPEPAEYAGPGPEPPRWLWGAQA